MPWWLCVVVFFVIFLVVLMLVALSGCRWCGGRSNRRTQRRREMRKKRLKKLLALESSFCEAGAGSIDGYGNGGFGFADSSTAENHLPYGLSEGSDLCSEPHPSGGGTSLHGSDQALSLVKDDGWQGRRFFGGIWPSWECMTAAEITGVCPDKLQEIIDHHEVFLLGRAFQGWLYYSDGDNDADVVPTMVSVATQCDDGDLVCPSCKSASALCQAQNDTIATLRQHIDNMTYFMGQWRQKFVVTKYIAAYRGFATTSRVVFMAIWARWSGYVTGKRSISWHRLSEVREVPVGEVGVQAMTVTRTCGVQAIELPFVPPFPSVEARVPIGNDKNESDREPPCSGLMGTPLSASIGVNTDVVTRGPFGYDRNESDRGPPCSGQTYTPTTASIGVNTDGDVGSASTMATMVTTMKSLLCHSGAMHLIARNVKDAALVLERQRVMMQHVGRHFWRRLQGEAHKHFVFEFTQDDFISAFLCYCTVKGRFGPPGTELTQSQQADLIAHIRGRWPELSVRQRQSEYKKWTSLFMALLEP